MLRGYHVAWMLCVCGMAYTSRCMRGLQVRCMGARVARKSAMHRCPRYIGVWFACNGCVLYGCVRYNNMGGFVA